MEALPSEASCPICLELFRDPVSIHCGHNFCRGCISRRWEWPTEGFPCPQCRQTAPERSLRPSRELARLVQGIARRLSLRLARGDALQEEEEEEEEEGGRCEKHQEPLRVFCKEDQALLCGVCRESRAHRAHTVLPVRDALQEFQEQILARLQTLRDDRDKLLAFREAEMRRNWEYLEKMGSERQRVLSLFQGLRVALEDHARGLLAQLGHLERDVEKEQEENVTRLTEEISRLDTWIQELEEKCQEPARTFLQGITSTLSRLQRDHPQLPPPPLQELEEKISHFREKNLVLEETLRSFQDILMFELPEKMPVTLDSSTAHPQLVVLPGGSGVRWEAPQDPPEEEFGPDPSVLGHEGVTSGRFCWDVEVTPVGSWALGVAKEALGRREETPESPREELWSMGRCQGQFWALTSLERVPLVQVQVPRRVRVSLDYERGRVAFWDAERRVPIFAFPAASFSGERIHPWFLVWGEGAQITLCP